MLSTLVILSPCTERTMDAIKVHRVFDYHGIVGILLGLAPHIEMDDIVFENDRCTSGCVDGDYYFDIYED